MPALRNRRFGRVVVAAAASGAAIAALALSTSTTANAAGPLPSTTTVTASHTAVVIGDSVTFTATVKVIGLPGLGVTPLGTVAFSVNGHAAFANPAIGGFSCFGTTCTATVTATVMAGNTSALPPGTDVVTAAFSGDSLAAPSSGTVTVTVAQPDQGKTVTCPAGQPCVDQLPADNVNGSNTTLKVTVNASANQQTVDAAAYANSAAQNCPGFSINVDAPWFVWSSTATDAAKTILVDYNGNVANQLYQAPNSIATEKYFGCYSSTQPFKGAVLSGSTYVYGNAPQVQESDGTFYQAPLFNCANTTPVNTAPCYTVHVTTHDAPPYNPEKGKNKCDGDNDSDDGAANGCPQAATDVQLTINAPAGDPKWMP
jgi:hypothetical protein